MNKKMKQNSYKTLGGMICISLIIMYLAMFLNVDDSSHIFMSITRFYMAVLMVSPMAVLMLLMMRHMFINRKLNAVIIVASALIFVIALTLLRSQTPIGDRQYMRAMIPHHSSAILTSKHANIQDPEVKKLSESIIESQEKEIRQMKAILKRMQH